MLFHWLKCRKNTESKNPKAAKIKKGRTMLSSNCVVCSSKRLRFVKEQEPSRLLSSLSIRTLLSHIHLVGPLMFLWYKMNKVLNSSFLAGHRFMPDMNL